MPIIQSVERALQILDLFNEHTIELKITEISDQMGLHKSTVHSLLKTLQQSRYIDQNPENGKYRLGLKLVERGNLVINTLNIRQIANKYLVELALRTGQTCHLGILDGNAGVYIDKEEGANSVIRYSRIGRRIPLHCTAIGKLLLSYQKQEIIDSLLDGYPFTQATNQTITKKEDFLIELEKVRHNEYAVDDQENELGVRCIAVPIINQHGQILAALSISTLVSRVGDDILEDYIQLLKKTGKELSEEMRYGVAMK